MRRVHFAFIAVLLALSGGAVAVGAPVAVTGTVRDSAGVPQVGATVQLLRPDMTVIASVYTDNRGMFIIASVAPGQYALKAMGQSFLPSLREDVRVRTRTVVNLTLNSLYEVMQWLPSEPRSSSAQQDDWKFTLCSPANRPLLRWLEDGPLVVVHDGSGATPKLKARLMATGQEGTFGESGERISATMEETPSNSRALLARVDFAPDSAAGMESMLGFRQDLGYAGSVQSVAAVAIHPEMEAGVSDGLDEGAVRTWETMRLGDSLEAEAGSTAVMARFAANTPNTVLATLPFGQVAWRQGEQLIRYRVATAVPGRPGGADSEAGTWLPAVAVRQGRLSMEHGLHQEIGWERQTDRTGVSVLLFSDSVDNPVLQAAGRGAAFGGGAGGAAAAEWIYDPASGMIHMAGPGYSSTGMMAWMDTRLPGGDQLRLSYTNGDALAAPTRATLPAAQMAQLLAAVRPKRTQAYSISLSGTIEGTGTRWRASYRLQPEETLTPVAAYAANEAEPYLNLHLRQAIHMGRDGRREGQTGFEALIDLRNLLAQGYQSYVLSDGSVVVLAQDQRGVSGGLAFTF
jgi:hypothetical protein